MRGSRRTGLLATLALMSALSTLAIAQTLGEAELKKLAVGAKSAEEHAKLAAHYRAHAVEHEGDAKLHEEIAKALEKASRTDDDAWDLARDAHHYAGHSREAAEALRDLAVAHQAIADRLKKK